MVGTSGVICTVMELQRVEKYLVSTASMIFWIMVC